MDEINDRAGSSIPLHSFEFVDFGDVSCRDKDTSLLTGGFSWELIVSLQWMLLFAHVWIDPFTCLLADVIGQIVSIEDEGRTWKWDGLRNISFRNIHLRDLGWWFTNLPSKSSFYFCGSTLLYVLLFTGESNWMSLSLEIWVAISTQSRFSSKAKKSQLLLFLQGCLLSTTRVWSILSVISLTA